MVAPLLKQTWVASAVLINMLGLGLILGYPSCLLPGLLAPDSDIKTDRETASWLASAVGLSSLLGFIISSLVMEWRGRRLANIVALCPSIVGWILIYFGSNVTTLMIGRILSGIATGGTVTLGAITLSEYTSPKSRGTFLGLKTATVCFGTLVTHILAQYFHWRTVAAMALIPQVTSILIVFTWPESPSWLISKGKFEESEEAFFWLRGKNDETNREILNMLKSQKERLSQATRKLCFSERVKEFLMKFTRRDFILPTIITCFAAIILEASGRHYFAAYASQIIGGFTENRTESFYFTLCMDIITTVSATFSCFLIKIMKRRTLLFGTGFAALFVLMCICLHLFLSDKGFISKDHPWIPVTLLVVYFILVNLGCAPIPLAICGEIYPLQHRGAGTIVSGFSLSMTLMVALKVTPNLLDSVKVYGTFAVFGTSIGLSLLVLYFILPETKDRTLQEIEDYFTYGKYRDYETVKCDDMEAKMDMIKVEYRFNVINEKEKEEC